MVKPMAIAAHKGSQKICKPFRKVLVAKAGLEPAWGCPRQILSLLCLPFHHSARADIYNSDKVVRQGLLPRCAECERNIQITIDSFIRNITKKTAGTFKSVGCFVCYEREVHLSAQIFAQLLSQSGWMQKTGRYFIISEKIFWPRLSLCPWHQLFPTGPGWKINAVNVGDLFQKGLFIPRHSSSNVWISWPAVRWYNLSSISRVALQSWIRQVIRVDILTKTLFYIPGTDHFQLRDESLPSLSDKNGHCE